MFRKVCLFLILLVVSLGSHGAENLARNPGFEEGATDWEFEGENVQVVQGEGRRGSACVKITLTEPGSFAIKRAGEPVKAGRRFRHGFWYRIENTSPECKVLYHLEDWEAGQYCGGIAAGWHTLPPDQEGWIYAEEEEKISLNPHADYISIICTEPRKFTGTIWIDDIILEPIQDKWDFSIVYPTHKWLSPTGGLAKFVSRFEDIPLADQRLDMIVMKDGATLWSKSGIAPEGTTFGLKMPALPEDTYTLYVILRNATTDEIIGLHEMEVVAHALPENATHFDEKGNILVNGEKFLPVGGYDGILSKDVVDFLTDTGFNCVISYCTIWHADSTGTDFIKGFREALDYCHEKGLMVIPTLKMFYPTRDNVTEYCGVSGLENLVKTWVDAFKDHPAILAWYLADEPYDAELPMLDDVFKLVSQTDPFHPATACLTPPQSIPRFSQICDISHFDCYPRFAKSNIHNTYTASQYIKNLGVPFWWTGQIMHWGHYKENKDRSWYPSECEILAQNLMVFIHGAKGILNYHCGHLVLPGDEDLKEKRTSEWKNANLATSALKDFILSDVECPQPQIQQVSGLTAGRIFTDGQGNYRLLLVAPDDGTNLAKIKLPEGMRFVKSQRGATIPRDDATLEFGGQDVVCDIVEIIGE